MKKTLTISAMTLLIAGLAQAETSTFFLTEHQTVDGANAFPAAGSNNIDKFDTLGSGDSKVAPFTTTAYIRGTGTAQAQVQLYLQFDLTGLTTGTITSATLEFEAYSLNDRDGQNPTLDVHQLTDDWASAGAPDPVFDPATVTTIATGQSIVSGTELDLYSNTETVSAIYRKTTTYSLNVTSIITNWQNGDINNGLMLDFSSVLGNGLGLDVTSVKIVTIPEPGTYALLAGLTGFTFVTVRRHKA